MGKQVFFHTLTAALESPDLIRLGSVMFEGIFPYTAATVGLDRFAAIRRASVGRLVAKRRDAAKPRE
jgi:hypothetical protein